ncbi:hypothetical protein AVEN_248773-1 [Araneus ventricosus]|uniref:Uncharacterized protein n=1 Tax=Araneus ventricosus TaxID=182803 RepID=A0A4Y2CHH3_ARAVE|nr:hypothetical protein AVEN_248773-1 [Araneus ventricosus]
MSQSGRSVNGESGKWHIHDQAVPLSFGARHTKTLRQCKNPLRIGVDRGKVWKSSIVGLPFSARGQKIEIQSYKEGRMLSPDPSWE